MKVNITQNPNPNSKKGKYEPKYETIRIRSEKKMRPNCLYENCLCRQGKTGFCVKHREIGEAVEALLLLRKITNLSCNETK